MGAQYWFILFAIAQGSAVLGLTFFIFLYYVPKRRAQITNLRLHVMLVSFSYICLTLATIQTAATGNVWGGFWYWTVTIAYIMGDISLIFIFRACVKRDAHIKIKEKQNQ